MFYQTIMISTRIRTGSHSSSARFTICCVLFCWLCSVGAFCDILLKARRGKVHTAILHILHIRNKAIVTGRVQRCNADTQNFCRFFSRNKFFHKAYFLQSVKFIIVFVQNHMNTLAAETTSAWYLVLNRKRQTLPIYISQLSSHLPRPLTMGTQQVSAGADVITPQHRSYRVPQGSPQVFGGP